MWEAKLGEINITKFTQLENGRAKIQIQSNYTASLS